MVQEDTSTDIVTVEAEEVSEESPLLVAQRYLNIFRQMHIFKAKKRTEFDTELLNMPEKIKRLLIDIPGGRILLEHLLVLEEQNGFDTQLTKTLISQKKKNSSADSSNSSHLQGELHLGEDFANVLAKSLASALGHSPYQPRIMQIPQISSENGELVSSATDEQGKQQNTQNNVAATTVNNINVDYSIFQNLAEAISQTNSSLAQVLRENSRQQLEEIKTFSKTLTNALLGKTELPKPSASKVQPATSKPFTSAEVKRSNTSTQTISVTNKTIDPITSKSSVQKTSFNIPGNTSPINTFKPTAPAPKKANPLLQAENAISRTGLEVKPISLSTEENISSFTPTPKQEAPKDKASAYEEFSLDENLNMHSTQAPTYEEEWEYVDEYGNPVNLAPQPAKKETTSIIQTQTTPTQNIETSAQPKAEATPVFPPEIKVAETPASEKPRIEEKTAEKEVAPSSPIKETGSSEKISSLSQETNEAKGHKSGGIFSSLFKKKETTQEKLADEPKKDSADDILAGAFGKKETTQEKPADKPKKDSADDILAGAFGKTETTQEKLADKPKKDSADDILAGAFGKTETTQEPKKEQTPRMGGILAEAFQEIEREQKTISSKDLLAQAKKNKPQTTADVLADAFAQKSNKPANNDVLADAFATKIKSEEQHENKTKQNTTDDVLASAFANPEDKNKRDDGFDALIKAFNS